MVYFGNAYKRQINPGQHTSPVTVALYRLYLDEPIKVAVDHFGSHCCFMSPDDAEELVEALQEVIALRRAIEDEGILHGDAIFYPFPRLGDDPNARM